MLCWYFLAAITMTITNLQTLKLVNKKVFT